MINDDKSARGFPKQPPNKQTNKTRGCAAVAKVVQPKKMP